MTKASSIWENLQFSEMVHFWGRGASGKTTLAAMISADCSRSGIVEWLSVDGKHSSALILKEHLNRREGRPENLRIRFEDNHLSAYQAVLSLTDQIRPETELVVIDSITRVLDFSRKDPSLWGRELFEDILPSLAALVYRYDVKMIMVSEVRVYVDEPVAVHHDSIKRWLEPGCDFFFNRIGKLTRIFRTCDNTEIASIVFEKGHPKMVQNSGGELDCSSESPCSVW